MLWKKKELTVTLFNTILIMFELPAYYKIPTRTPGILSVVYCVFVW